MTGYILFFYFWPHFAKAPVLSTAHFGHEPACMAAGNALVDKLAKDATGGIWFRCIPDGKVRK